MTKAIGYLRVSSVTQIDGTSLDEQKARVQAFCREAGYELTELVEDRGRSGTVKEGEVFGWESRPSLMQIMQRAEAGEFQAVVVAKFDRLSRDHMTTVAVRRMLSRHGVQLHSAGERNGDSAADILQQNILASVAEFEASLIRTRLALGKSRRKQEGRHVHGQVPYGYTSDRGVLTPLEPEASTVRLIYSLAVRNGLSLRKIAARLNADGVTPRRSARWSASTIQSVLGNVVYAGERYGKKRAHSALISRRTWNEAQARTRP